MVSRKSGSGFSSSTLISGVEGVGTGVVGVPGVVLPLGHAREVVGAVHTVILPVVATPGRVDFGLLQQ